MATIEATRGHAPSVEVDPALIDPVRPAPITPLPETVAPTAATVPAEPRAWPQVPHQTPRARAAPAAETEIDYRKVAVFCGALLLLIVIIALLASRGCGEHGSVGAGSELDAAESETGAEPVPTTDTPDTAVEPVAAAGPCPVVVTTIPAGAEIELAGAVVATTPATISLPCGVPATLVLRKPPRYIAAEHSVTPALDAKPVSVELEHVLFSVDVRSIPSGATVSLGPNSLGVTPINLKLPAFQTVTLRFTKDGFATDLHRVSLKQDHQIVETTLQKASTAAPKATTQRPAQPRPR